MEKRKYTKQFNVQLAKQEHFLLNHIRNEWKMIERGKEREKLMDFTKAGGKAIGKMFLTLLLVGGVVTIATVAPNIISVFGKRKNGHRFFSKKNLQRSLTKYKARKYITKNLNSAGESEICLTELGKQRAMRSIFENLNVLSREGKWDGVWRMVMFDIPERHKYAREGLRDKLKIMGFFSLQKSVFVYPYVCREEAEFLSNLYNISAYVSYGEISFLSNENELKEYFGV